MYGIIAAVVIALLGAAALLWEIVFKAKWKARQAAKEAASDVPEKGGASKPADPSAPPSGIHLTKAQVEKLFDEALARRWREKGGGTTDTLQIVIVKVGTWVVTPNDLRRPKSGDHPEMKGTIDSLDTFNDLLSQKEYNEGYLVGLYLRGRIKLDGDKSKLEQFGGFMRLLRNEREAILEEIGA